MDDPLLDHQAINLAAGASATINRVADSAGWRSRPAGEHGDGDLLAGRVPERADRVGHPHGRSRPSELHADQGGAPSSANVGDQITYTFVVTNTGDVGLNRVSANDTLLGNITAAFPASLAPGASATVTQTRSILASDPDPLPNTVTVVYQVNGSPNQLTRGELQR